MVLDWKLNTNWSLSGAALLKVHTLLPVNTDIAHVLLDLHKLRLGIYM